jgi:hypothetical protein
MKRVAFIAALGLMLPVAAVAAETPTPDSYGAAMRWYERAAEAGSAKAQFYLGLMHETGQGRPADPAAALGWYRRSAEQGFAMAQFKVGLFLDRGTGAAVDARAAASWYEKAASQGFAPAQYNLGLLYAEGRGVDRDVASAWAWLDRAAAKLPEAAAARDQLAGIMTAEELEAARAKARAPASPSP